MHLSPVTYIYLHVPILSVLRKRIFAMLTTKTNFYLSITIFIMKQISTAVYLLIAVVIILLAITMVKPIIVDKTGAETSQIKFFNFKKLA